MNVVIHPDPKQLAAMAPHALDSQCVEAMIERQETHDAQVKRIAKDRLKAKLSMLDPKDLAAPLCLTPRSRCSVSCGMVRVGRSAGRLRDECDRA